MAEILEAATALRTERERLYSIRKGTSTTNTSKKRRRENQGPSLPTTSSSSSSSSSTTAAPSKSRHVVDQSDYGKYGIIHESDLGNRRQEFDAWLRDHKQVDPSSELKSKADTMRYFKDYMEDFNTASLPHEKYYDLHAYEFKRQRLEASQGRGRGAEDAGVDVCDDAIHKRQLANKARAQKVAEAYKALTSVDVAKMEAMKAQDLLRARQKQAYSMQDKETLKKITRKLEADKV
jgi:hypothetical protein